MSLFPSKSEKSKQTQTENKAEAILAGALQEFLEHGYVGASVDRLAKAAGVSKPTLYSYFNDKADLFAAVVRRRFQSFQHTADLLPNPVPEDADPAQVLRQILNTLLSQMMSNAEQHHDFMRMLLGESGRFPELAQEIVRTVHKPVIEALSRLLATHPKISCQDPEMTASMLVGALIYYMMTQHIFQASEILPLERDRYLNTLVAMVVR